MKTYTIIAGVNGTGKSSLTGVLRTEMTDLGRIIDVDRLIAEQGSVMKGGKEAVRLIEDCLEKGICFTQETTLSGHKTALTAKQALEKGYHIRLYYIGLNTVEECLARIQNRVRKGGHSIPEADVRRRYENRFENLMSILPYCHEAVFYDNGNGFAAVARYRNGDLLPIGDFRPLWLEELMKKLEETER